MINNPSANALTGLYIEKITQWHYDRNLIHGSSSAAQLKKLLEEVGELCSNVAQGKSIKDDIGDVITVLINLAEREGMTIQDCLAQAYGDIKDRTGRMVNGVFVKDK